MSSIFVDTHNMVAILEKSDVAKGFEQIIDFLSGCYIHYALTVNPHIYISSIKQFWNTAFVKRSDDVTRLQALVDKKKIMISEDVIREILQLDDAEGVVCLPNEEIFAGLAQMGYDKPAKRTSWNEFSSAMASAETIVEDVANEAIPSTPLILPSPPSHEQSLPPQQPKSLPQAPPQGAKFPTHLFQQVLDTCSALTRCVKSLEHDKAAQKLAIIKLHARVKRLERANKGRMIDNIDKYEGIKLVVDQVRDADTAKTKGRHAAEQAQKQAEIYHLDLDHPFKVLSMQEDDSEVKEVVEVVTIAKLITDVVAVATSQASATISADKPSIPAAAPTVVAAYTRRKKGVIIEDPEEDLSSKTPAETPKLKDKGKGILIETPKPMKKKVQIELDTEYARKLHEEINKDHEEINKDIDWDAAIDHVNQKSIGNQYIKRYHGMKKRPQTENDEIRPIFQARFDANMRFLLKSREEMEEEDREILKSINETPAQKAAKKMKLNKKTQEVKDLKKHLEVVNDEDDDVFTKATPLGRKEEGIDYEEVFAPVARIEAIRLFLAYASFMGFLVYQMDVKSAFLYGTIEEEVYVCQPPGFEDLENPNKVYKVVKALYGLHKAPRACEPKSFTPQCSQENLLILEGKALLGLMVAKGFTL
nr:retrovirus-related Pol polyprotein from transposon TNT 1-94 [Tanacetum cinerariifolium]